MIQINWNAIPEVYNWAAADAGGQLWAYQKEPRYSETCGQWYMPPPDIKMMPLLLCEIDLTGIDSRDTLTRRPAYSEKPNSHLGAKESAFIISIDDGYCKWEYGFQPENISSVSIEQIKKVIEEQFKTKMVYAKLIEPYSNRSEKPENLVCDGCKWVEIGGKIYQCTTCLKVEDRL